MGIQMTQVYMKIWKTVDKWNKRTKPQQQLRWVTVATIDMGRNERGLCPF